MEKEEKEKKEKEKKEKKFRVEKHEIDNHEISSLLVGEDKSNIEYVDVEVLDFAIVMSVKYIHNVLEDKEKDKEKDNIPVDIAEEGKK